MAKQVIRHSTVTWRQRHTHDAGYDIFQIPREVAESLFKEGKIAQDMTNGGYCPGRTLPRINMTAYKVREGSF